MTTEVRRWLEALYGEHVHPRTDGGLPLNVDDHIHCIKTAAEMGISDRELADAMGVPLNYILSFKHAIGIP
jgi:hypothetical protein